MMIGVLVPELGNSFATSIIMNVENLLLEHGYGTMICTYCYDSELEYKKLKWYVDKHVDGIIFMPSASMQKSGLLKIKEIIEEKLPVILFDGIIDSFKFDSILVDNINASYTAMETFIRYRHRNIAIIIANPDATSQWERIEGYKRALSDYGLPFNPDYLKYSGYGKREGYSSCREILRKSPEVTAILSTGYRLTLGVLQAIQESERVLGKDISLIGFDCGDIAKISSPPLTTLDQPTKQIASKVVEVLLMRMSGDRKSPKELLRLKTTFTHGESVCEVREPTTPP